ncbi:hypothetical protein EOD41_01975 [Mucilaginibacter limnophilus]|uniref:Spore coat protein CotH n=1 Tax=Mucilaginibacter limnophilus TaxID=1932778 RepID=A0A437MYH4_9SPHI|nr:CotH kinase family protein [Mucilaginibacter limnophilus]RVU02731.1 hypothetical protein EOD41_01975 [Mucilaginibacter limnophilus]
MLLRRTLLCFLLAATVWSCKKESKIVDPPITEDPTDSAALTSVVIEAKNNAGKVSANVTATIVGNEISAVVPILSNNKKFAITFTTLAEGTIVKGNDTTLTSGSTVTDFSKPVTYTLTTPKGATRTYKFKIKNFTGVPIFYLTTSGPVVSKDNYVTGTLVINPNADFEQTKNNISLQIKGRGNSTWTMPKKPYRLKFDSKASVLGLPEAKNWVLLANYSDKTLLRTSIAFDLGAKLGGDFTPKGRHVEVVMNGEYLGSYLLTSQVEVHENRINIKELDEDDNSADKITGGYLLEWDERLDEAVWFRTEIANAPFTIKSPEDITDAQLAYIKGYIQDTENTLFSDNFKDPVNGYVKYINVDSFINWYIVQELMKNQDAMSFSSIYFYKDRGGKLSMGPLWDFDLAAGNVDYSDAVNPTGWWIRSGPWFGRLFQDPVFRTKVKTRWNAIKGKELAGINASIDSTVNYINLSQQQNFVKWPILNQKVWPNPVVMGTYPKEVDRVKTWLAQRAAWLDGQFNSM